MTSLKTIGENTPCDITSSHSISFLARVTAKFRQLLTIIIYMNYKNDVGGSKTVWNMQLKSSYSSNKF